MPKKTTEKLNNSEGYTIDEVRDHMEKFLDESTERLRLKLRAAWKKQRTKSYANSKI